MNAKKIMGAVLVALLAAALFVGAGAAAEPISNGGVVFVYEIVKDGSGAGETVAGTWTHANGVNTLTFVTLNAGEYAIVGDNVVEGTYTKGDVSISVMYPTGNIVASAAANGINYNIVNGIYYINDVITDNAVGPITSIQPVGFAVTGPDGILKKVNIGTLLSALALPGTYKVQVYYDVFDSSSNAVFVETTDPVKLIGKDAFTITVKRAGDAEITAAADTIIKGEGVAVTIVGQPGKVYQISANGFTFPEQFVTIYDQANNAVVDARDVAYVKISNDGETTISLVAYETGSKSINVVGADASVDVEVINGEITIEADKENYFVGETIELSGTASGAPYLYFYVEGTNVKLAQIESVGVDADKTWKVEISYEDLQNAVLPQGLYKLDAGSYTIYAATANKAAPAYGPVVENAIEADNEIYSTIVVNLKQPFLTAELQTSVVAQGSNLVVTGTAESAEKVRYYIFGTNFFESKEIDVKKKDSSFKIDMKIKKEEMAAGQYFLVVQHPMYDEDFNIAPNATIQNKSIILNTTGEASITPIAADGSNILFKVNERQTSNAAEALCQAIDTENIDDIYVKASFIVAAPSLTMNPVASEIAQGEKITVSGTTNLAPGSTVTVEMLSTAFAAVPKASVNSASFIALTTKVADDGTWEVTFDTTGLNVDEYTLTATAGEFVNTAKDKVVEAAPKQPDTPDTPDVPDTPDTPDTPDVPETPGFGALAALAGLGAVAVLLLRRE